MKNKWTIFAGLILSVAMLAGCVATPAAVVPEATMESSTPELTTVMPATETAMAETETATPEVSASPTDDDFEVEIENFAYDPEILTVKIGTTVTWTNKDSVGHTATSDNGVFDSGMLQKGESFSFTFTQAGTYEYFCAPHPYMVATIVVME